MDQQNPDLLDRLRQQFNATPYPGIDITEAPNNSPAYLYLHNLATAYYLRYQRVIDSKDKLILDAGCGSGYKALSLAIANPGAKIIGVDLSETSIEKAKERLAYHGFDNAEFHAMPLEYVPTLGLEFDYINNDEVLYLIPDPPGGLQAMKTVLKPEGIIRTNLHSKLQRSKFYRAQNLCHLLGLTEENPEEAEIEMLTELMRSIKDDTNLKKNTWSKNFEEKPNATLANHLLVGDKGFNIAEMFALLEASDLELVSMTDFRSWNLQGLFKSQENLPDFLQKFLNNLSFPEQLRVFELLQSNHRLFDFWCGHVGKNNNFTPITAWTESDWAKAKIYLHPQLQTPAFIAEANRCASQLNPLEISRYLPTVPQSNLDSIIVATVILPLLESPRTLEELVMRSQQLRPYDLQTLKPVTPQSTQETIISTLTGLEYLGYIVLSVNG
jgi:ubiquinone/menaquinone biosynthesis C-methylase UbiE